jgi:hypothetical protein
MCRISYLRSFGRSVDSSLLVLGRYQRPRHEGNDHLAGTVWRHQLHSESVVNPSVARLIAKPANCTETGYQ